MCYGQALQGVQTAHTSRRRFSPICLETVILSPCSGSSLQATSYVHLTSATKPLVIYLFPSFFFQSGHWPQFVKIRRNNFPLLGTVMVMWGIGNVTIPSVVVKWWDLNLAELCLYARSGGRLKNPRCPHRFVYDRALRITDNNPGNHCGSGTWASRGGAN